VCADSIPSAKHRGFNQFLKLEKDNIIWSGTPTFWVTCLGVNQVSKRNFQNILTSNNVPES